MVEVDSEEIVVDSVVVEADLEETAEVSVVAAEVSTEVAEAAVDSVVEIVEASEEVIVEDSEVTEEVASVEEIVAVTEEDSAEDVAVAVAATTPIWNKERMTGHVNNVETATLHSDGNVTNVKLQGLTVEQAVVVAEVEAHQEEIDTDHIEL